MSFKSTKLSYDRKTSLLHSKKLSLLKRRLTLGHSEMKLSLKKSIIFIIVLGWVLLKNAFIFNAAQPGVGRVQVLGSKKLLQKELLDQSMV